MTQPTWCSDDVRMTYPALNEDLTVDVGIVGGGITGCISAYLLKRAGLRVALLERNQCGDGETGHTTAHLSYVTDKRLHKLVDDFGIDVAQAVWEAGTTAIDLIEQIVEAEDIDCDFTRLPGYLHAAWDAEDDRDRRSLERDNQAATSIGLSPVLLDFVPVANRFGIRFANQATFHPLKFLAAVLRHVDGEGSRVFEQTQVDEISDDATIHANGRRVACRYVIVATHVPLQGKSGALPAALLQSRLAAFNSYAVAAKLPAETAEESLLWDTSDPYYYLRLENRGDFQTAIFGGEDHKTGQQADDAEPFAALTERLHDIFPQAEMTDLWSGQVIETNDQLPLIGETAENQFVATGFAGNGLTFGAFAALLIRDAIVQQPNAWQDLFSPTRVHLKGGTWRYLKESIDFPRYLALDRLTLGGNDTLDDVPIGSGRVLTLDGKHVAVHRDAQGELNCVSAVCSHLGCLVRWNRAEQTWDCPCHGSRFASSGKVIAGPAEQPLEEYSCIELKKD
jgi:glycine/D-amino acid oxidase-like deaminating enzyme/nitrite reductase/ring-hydroxylating ferredoxin subunit